MEFLNDAHQDFFEKMVARTRTQDDPYRKALFYALGLTRETRANIDDVYDFAEHCPRFSAIRKGWQTSTSAKVTRLAFNLYNGYNGNRSDAQKWYSPYELFGDGLMEYMFEAVRLLYPHYSAAETESSRRFERELLKETES